MRVLFLCNLPSAANSGSHQRLLHLLRGVAAAGEVTLIYPVKGHAFGPDLEALRPFCKQVFTFPFESLAYQRDSRLPRPFYWFTHKLRYLHPVTPATVQQLRSTEAKALVADLCSQRFDLIWGQRISSLWMLPRSVTSRVIIDLDDLEHRSLRSRRLLGKDPPHMIPLQWFEFLKLRRMECSLAELPYEFVVCSEPDREVVGRSAKVWVIPNGIDLPAQPTRLGDENSEPVLLFVGYMGYEPNADAATFFANTVLPLVQRQIPNVKFLIVGRDPTASVRQLDDGKSVFVTGAVPNVADYLLDASVVVAPIRFGGGTRIKILEALAHRKAVVSTTKGAEGIDVQPNKHLLLADSPEDLAKACTRLLKDAALRKHLGEQGHYLIRDRYQWKDIERMIGGIVLGHAVLPEELRDGAALVNHD
jgi:glycosyltransferase involved in cell wall biosynthesis